MLIMKLIFNTAYTVNTTKKALKHDKVLFWIVWKKPNNGNSVDEGKRCENGISTGKTESGHTQAIKQWRNR